MSTEVIVTKNNINKYRAIIAILVCCLIAIIGWITYYVVSEETAKQKQIEQEKILQELRMQAEKQTEDRLDLYAQLKDVFNSPKYVNQFISAMICADTTQSALLEMEKVANNFAAESEAFHQINIENTAYTEHDIRIYKAKAQIIHDMSYLLEDMVYFVNNYGPGHAKEIRERFGKQYNDLCELIELTNATMWKTMGELSN